MIFFFMKIKILFLNIETIAWSNIEINFNNEIEF